MLGRVNFDFVNKNFKTILEKEYKVNCLLKEDLTYTEYNNAEIATEIFFDNGLNYMQYSGVYTETGEPVDNSFVHEGLCKTKLKYEADIEYEPLTVIFIANIFKAYGHVFTDGIKKLWFLDTPQYRSLIENGAKLVYIGNFEKVPEYVSDIFKMAGFELSNAEFVNKRKRYKKIIVPDSSIILKKEQKNQRYYFKEYVNTVNKIKEKIYLLNMLSPFVKTVFKKLISGKL